MTLPYLLIDAYYEISISELAGKYSLPRYVVKKWLKHINKSGMLWCDRWWNRECDYDDMPSDWQKAWDLCCDLYGEGKPVTIDKPLRKRKRRR